ncbi:MAG: A/G-specific adenine glycosylase [Alicyclobacillaceae bacterium]|nr:A/G-specific adenine glycosylase [Alicyclobacillaceae bacterium]
MEDRARRRLLAVGPLLTGWYRRESRDLPWRKTKDPYRIWVSEVMLQQTRVETVVPYYERFLHRFPTVDRLAEAPEEEVLKYWEGLGYYSRAKNLHRGAQMVVERFGGEIPADPGKLRGIPGIGEYTAGAILSMAYDRDATAVDGNALRVFSRLFLIADPVDRPAGRKKVRDLVEAAIPPGEASVFNQAVMDLGARLCLPKGPKCEECPLRNHCAAAEEGVAEQYPVKTPKKRPVPVKMAAALVVENGRWLIRRRPEEGLLAGLWELPSAEKAEEETWEEAAARAVGASGLRVRVSKEVVRVEHIFSHRKWDLRIYRCTPVTGENAAGPFFPPGDGPDRWTWATPEECAAYPFPTAYRKVWPSLIREGV